MLPFRFLYDKSSLEYLYYKRRVAELRKDLLRPENTSDNGKITSFHPVFYLCFLSLAFPHTSMKMQKGWTLCRCDIVSTNDHFYSMTSYEQQLTILSIMLMIIIMFNSFVCIYTQVSVLQTLFYVCLTVILFLTDQLRWLRQEQSGLSHCLFEVCTLSETVLLKEVFSCI